MNIAIFCAYFYPHNGGVEQYIQKLFSNLEKINVTVITSNTENSKRYEKKFGIEIYRFDSWHLMSKTYPVIKFKEYKHIKKIFEEKKFDYVITQTRFFNSSLLGLKFSKKFNIPLIHFEHGTMHSPIKNPLLHQLGVIYDHTIGKLIIKNSKKTIGISKASEKFVKHIYTKAATSVIYNSIEVDNFSLKNTNQINNKNLKIKLNISNKDKIIIYIGRVIYAKGIQDIFEAIKNIQNIKIIIIGDGNYLEELKKKYPEGIYLGNIPQEELQKYLNIADIFINPSYAEGLPTSVLEAGASGRAIIATNVGGTNEIIKNNINGLLYKPKDINSLSKNIKKLLSNNKIKFKFENNIKNFIKEKFDVKANKKILIRELKK